MFLFALSATLCLGAIAEIVLAVHPGLLPSEAVAIPFIAAHQTSWPLRSWVLGSNVVNLVCAVTMMRSVIAIRAGRAHGWRRLRAATGVLAGIAVVGVLVCLPYLLPLPTGPDAEPSRIMLSSVVCAGGGLAMLCTLLFRFANHRVR
jgi:hypothetical protein